MGILGLAAESMIGRWKKERMRYAGFLPYFFPVEDLARLINSQRMSDPNYLKVASQSYNKEWKYIPRGSLRAGDAISPDNPLSKDLLSGLSLLLDDLSTVKTTLAEGNRIPYEDLTTLLTYMLHGQHRIKSPKDLEIIVSEPAPGQIARARFCIETE